jgi:anti-anti-sigma regulatory factor
MDADDLTVKTVRDGTVCTRSLGGALDLLVLDLAGVTFLDCSGVRALAIATCFAPSSCPVIIRSLSRPARRIITALGTDDIENLRRLTAGPQLQDGRRGGGTGEQQLVPVTWGDLDVEA